MKQVDKMENTNKKINKRKAPKNHKGKPLPIIWLTSDKMPKKTIPVTVKIDDYELFGWIDNDKVVCSLYTYSPPERAKINRMIRGSKSTATLIIPPEKK